MDDEEEWNDLDQVSVRTSIRELIRDLPEDSYDQRLTALGQLRSMVMEEIAKGFYLSFTHIMQTHPKETLPESKAIVERLSNDLDALGLGIKHPETAEPMRLTLSKTPPTENESWFQLEPMTAGSGTRPMRLPRPIPYLHLCEAPTLNAGRDKDGPRR